MKSLVWMVLAILVILWMGVLLEYKSPSETEEYDIVKERKPFQESHCYAFDDAETEFGLSYPIEIIKKSVKHPHYYLFRTHFKSAGWGSRLVDKFDERKYLEVKCPSDKEGGGD